MLNLMDLSSQDLKKILVLRIEMEKQEAELERLLKGAEKRADSISGAMKRIPIPRNLQPSLQEMISGVLKKAGRPMPVAEIYKASVEAGYMWRSRNPMNALKVKIYTDDTFKKAAPGKFVLRGKG